MTAPTHLSALPLIHPRIHPSIYPSILTPLIHPSIHSLPYPSLQPRNKTSFRLPVRSFTLLRTSRWSLGWVWLIRNRDIHGYSRYSEVPWDIQTVSIQEAI
jgi:hypothetical protein